MPHVAIWVLFDRSAGTEFRPKLFGSEAAAHAELRRMVETAWGEGEAFNGTLRAFPGLQQAGEEMLTTATQPEWSWAIEKHVVEVPRVED